MNTVDKYKVYQVNPTTGLPVTAGDATAANQATEIANLASILAKLADPATQTTLAALVALFPTSLGQKVKTTSLAVSPPSDYQQPILPVNSGIAPLTSVSSNNADMLAAMDASNYRCGVVQILGTWSATVSPQVSYDAGSTWVTLSATQSAAVVSPPATITSNGVFVFSIPPNALLRIRTTVYASGTVTGFYALSSIQVPNVTTAVSLYSTGGTGLSAAGSDAFANATGVQTVNQNLSWNGANWERARVPNIFKTAVATASGDTAVWTPTSGKKFRLMRFRIEVTGQSTQAVSGNLEIIFRDASTGMPLGCSIFVPSVSLNQFASYSTGWIDLGNGILSAAANNVLNINLGAALATGEARVIACGTEE